MILVPTLPVPACIAIKKSKESDFGTSLAAHCVAVAVAPRADKLTRHLLPSPGPPSAHCGGGIADLRAETSNNLVDKSVVSW